MKCLLVNGNLCVFFSFRLLFKWEFDWRRNFIGICKNVNGIRAISFAISSFDLNTSFFCLLPLFLFYWHHLNFFGKNQADTDCTKGHLVDQQLTIQRKRHKILLFNIINIHLLAVCVYCIICFSFKQCRFSFLFRQMYSKIFLSLSHPVSQSGKEYTVIVITMNFNQETWQFYLNYDSQFVGWWL